MSDVKEIILQTKNVEYIVNTYGKENWILVSGHKQLNGADAGFWCGFVKKSCVDIAFRDISWDISASHQGMPGFEGNGTEYEYHRNLLEDGLESLLFYREFFGVAKNYVELSQEFILLNNLRYDPNNKSYWAMYNSGESEEAARYISETSLEIKSKFLYRYGIVKKSVVV